jgi:hypothetical protein
MSRDAPDDKDKKVSESRLQRWSRLKNEDRTGSVAEESGPELPNELVTQEGSELEAEGEEQTTEEIVASLPDIESLDKDSDFTGFLQAGVPEELKNLALRKLWLSDPVLANVDGLNDYDEDFNVIDKVIEIASEALDNVSQSDDEKMANGEEREPESQNQDAPQVDAENHLVNDQSAELNEVELNQPDSNEAARGEEIIVTVDDFDVERGS